MTHYEKGPALKAASEDELVKYERHSRSVINSAESAVGLLLERTGAVIIESDEEHRLATAGTKKCD